MISLYILIIKITGIKVYPVVKRSLSTMFILQSSYKIKMSTG